MSIQDKAKARAALDAVATSAIALQPELRERIMAAYEHAIGARFIAVKLDLADVAQLLGINAEHEAQVDRVKAPRRS